MKHELHIEGARYALRPVRAEDSEFIIALRTDPELGRYLHETSPHVADQIAWIEAYERRDGDYYFMVEDRLLGEAVGAIGVYEIQDGAGEWGRWLIKRGSLAAVESLVLLCRVAFEQLGLERIFSRTIEENAKVVSFHESFGAKFSRRLPAHFVVRGVSYDTVEHVIDLERWAEIRPRVEGLAARVAQAAAR
jgi:RimJ/RimL family protein N-acetyltransferase